MIFFQSSHLSGTTVSFWYTSPDWLELIGLVSSKPSTSLYHSMAFLHIVLRCLYPTGHYWCQSRATSYSSDNCGCHSLSLSIVSIAMCICFLLTRHPNCDNAWRWVVMMWLTDMCLVVIGVATLLAYNLWTLSHCHLTSSSSSDILWPKHCDQS